MGANELHLLRERLFKMWKKLILVFVIAVGAAIASPLAIIVNPDVPVDDVSFSDLRKLFLGERQFWNAKVRVVLLMRAPVSPERDVVLRTIYQMSEAQFRQYWISKVFRADVSSGPKIVYSSDMANDLVSAIPGAVAFVDAAQVPKGAKILKIDGKLPTDKGYPLK
jgi:ABC-type phosphate transport system substrate-binding protein